MPVASSAKALQTVDALVQAARELPGARADRVALFGHSRGGGAALNYILQKAGVQAVVLDSAGYPSELADMAAQVKAPVLILHGTADSPREGAPPSRTYKWHAISRRHSDEPASRWKFGTTREPGDVPVAVEI